MGKSETSQKTGWEQLCGKPCVLVKSCEVPSFPVCTELEAPAVLVVHSAEQSLGQNRCLSIPEPKEQNMAESSLTASSLPTEPGRAAKEAPLAQQALLSCAGPCVLAEPCPQSSSTGASSAFSEQEHLNPAQVSDAAGELPRQGKGSHEMRETHFLLALYSSSPSRGLSASQAPPSKKALSSQGCFCPCSCRQAHSSTCWIIHATPSQSGPWHHISCLMWQNQYILEAVVVCGKLWDFERFLQLRNFASFLLFQLWVLFEQCTVSVQWFLNITTIVPRILEDTGLQEGLRCTVGSLLNIVKPNINSCFIFW